MTFASIKPCDLIMGAENHVYTEIRPADLPRDKEKIILLVHGFNVRQASAAGTLYGFVELLKAANPALQSSVRTSSWPGGLTLGPFDYAPALENAMLCAGLLVKQIQHWYTPGKQDCVPPRLIIFAHSMGCRLVLQALDILLREYPQTSGKPPSLQRLDVVLMAAAIPEGMIRTGGALAAAADVATHMYILHSESDWVLRWTFPSGQLLAGEERRGEAVGRRGKPRTVPEHHNMAKHRYGHDSYWRKPQTLKAVGNELGFTMLSGSGTALPEGRMAEGDLRTAPLLPFT